MRCLTIAILLSSICAGVVAQKPTDATAKGAVAASSPAADKWKLLGDQQSERAKGLKRGDNEGRATMFAARIGDLEGFIKEFPKAAEANKARVEIGQIATMDKKHADTAKAALAGFDANQGDIASAINAASIAGTLELTEQKAKLLDQIEIRAKTIDERVELVTALKIRMKDEERADKVLAATEAMAKTDEDKATLLMGKANITRYQDRKNVEGYKAALADVTKQFPATKSGKLAASKIAAANLGPGTDPVAFTTKDLDGKNVSPADYKGKVLLIDFWATWCGPCMAELPNVLKTYGEYHDKGFEILGISLDRDTDKEKLVSTIKERGMSWRHVYDGKYWQAEIAQLHDVQSIPFTILIGRDGKVIGTSLRGDKLGEAVQAAIEAK